MKNLLVAFSLILASVGHVRADTPVTNATAVKIVIPRKTQCVPKTIDNVTPTEITGNTAIVSTTAGVFSIKVVNLDTVAQICCSHDSAVACSGTHRGDQILQQASATTMFNFLAWSISTAQGWYCLSAGAAPTTAEVCTTQ